MQELFEEAFRLFKSEAEIFFQCRLKTEGCLCCHGMQFVKPFYGKCPLAMRSCSREAWFAFSLTEEPEVTTPADWEPV